MAPVGTGRHVPAVWFVLSLLAVLAAGCAKPLRPDPVDTWLDETTGATVTNLVTPLIFYRDEPGLAVNARDYLYVGPLEVNRAGRYRYLIGMSWFSTIDRGTRTGMDVPAAVYLQPDGRPMELRRAERDVAGIEWPYSPPLGGGPVVLFDITRAQLHVLARAETLTVRTEDQRHLFVTWRPWREVATGLQAFVRFLDEEPPERMGSARD